MRGSLPFLKWWKVKKLELTGRINILYPWNVFVWLATVQTHQLFKTRAVAPPGKVSDIRCLALTLIINLRIEWQIGTLWNSTSRMFFFWNSLDVIFLHGLVLLISTRALPMSDPGQSRVETILGTTLELPFCSEVILNSWLIPRCCLPVDRVKSPFYEGH